MRRPNRSSSSCAKIAAVAHAIGYESEAAFSRAFKKAAGVSPAAWRAHKPATGQLHALFDLR
jgi:AraC-like DNA-binding protein